VIPSTPRSSLPRTISTSPQRSSSISFIPNVPRYSQDGQRDRRSIPTLHPNRIELRLGLKRKKYSLAGGNQVKEEESCLPSSFQVLPFLLPRPPLRTVFLAHPFILFDRPSQSRSDSTSRRSSGFQLLDPRIHEIVVLHLNCMKHL
jgi:hypothetical protein